MEKHLVPEYDAEAFDPSLRCKMAFKAPLPQPEFRSGSDHWSFIKARQRVSGRNQRLLLAAYRPMARAEATGGSGR